MESQKTLVTVNEYGQACMPWREWMEYARQANGYYNRVRKLEKLVQAALRHDGHLADCPQDGPCEALCQDFRAAMGGRV